MDSIKKRFFLFLGCLISLASCSTISVRTDQQTQAVSLPDGSVVLLNQNSELEYQKDFSDRQVTLRGEAFFKVQKAKEPFVVSTSNGQITVLGTSFNVKEDDQQLEVEVETGSVQLKVKDQISKLKRGESAVYNDVKGLFEKGKAQFKHHVWTDDLKDDIKEIGEEAKKSGKKIGKEFQKLGRKIKKEVKD